MAKPNHLPRWSRSLGGAESNTVEPTSGKKDTGWKPNEPAPAQYFNWLAVNYYDWLAWLANGPHEVVRFPSPIPGLEGTWSAFAADISAYLSCTSSGQCQIDLAVPVGAQLKKIEFWLQGDGDADLHAEAWKVFADGSAAASIGSVDVLNAAASWAKYTLDVTDTTVTTAFTLRLLLDATIPGGADYLRVRQLTLTVAPHPTTDS